MINSKYLFTKALKKVAFNNKKQLNTVVRNHLRKLCLDEEMLTYTKYGFKMFASPKDYISYSIYFFGEYDPAMSTIMRYFIKEGQTVWDIGTERGWFSLLMGKLVGNGGRVDAFEAFLPNYTKLEKNINLNKMEWVFAHNLGVTKEKGSMWFVPPSNEVTNNISFLNECNGVGYLTSEYVDNAIKVPTISLDDFASQNEINDLSFIKIDIEGAEYDALLGAEKTIKHHKPILAIEYNKGTALRSGHSVEELDNLLDNYGYKRYVFFSKFVKFDFKMWEGLDIDQMVTNVYCFPK
ncbi:FkbM family methyltransferase [Pontibacter brevis]